MTYTITHRGAWISLNAAYSKHYHARNQEKTRFALAFADLLSAADVPWLAAFELMLRYNSRMDADNTIGGVKVFVDTMRAVGIIENDTKDVYRGVHIIPDSRLKHNTYVITLTALPT